MATDAPSHLSDLISTHGYWVIAIGVGLESMGIPVPGETMLITAAIYAGTTQQLNIAWVIASAALGAVVGDNIGFLIVGVSLPVSCGESRRSSCRSVRTSREHVRREIDM